MQRLRDVRFLGRIESGPLERNRVELDPADPLAAHVFERERLACEVAFGQFVEFVVAVRLQHVTLQHRVVRDPAQAHAMIRKHVRNQFHLLADLFRCSLSSHGFSLASVASNGNWSGAPA